MLGDGLEPSRGRGFWGGLLGGQPQALGPPLGGPGDLRPQGRLDLGDLAGTQLGLGPEPDHLAIVLGHFQAASR